MKTLKKTAPFFAISLISLSGFAQNCLQADYPFDGDISGTVIDEKGGVYSGLTYDGTTQTTLTTTAGHDGIPSGAYLLDGVDDHIQLNNNIGFVDGEFTISMWARVDSGNAGKNPLFSQRQTSIITIGPSIELFAHTANGDMSFSVSDETHSHITHIQVPAPPLGTWHHYAASISATNNEMKLYLDGNLVGTNNLPVGGVTGQTLNFTQGVDQVYIGRNSYIGNFNSNSQYFKGAISDVKTYSCVLDSNLLANINIGNTQSSAPCSNIPAWTSPFANSTDISLCNGFNNVGIGVTLPEYALDVAGSMRVGKNNVAQTNSINVHFLNPEGLIIGDAGFIIDNNDVALHSVSRSKHKFWVNESVNPIEALTILENGKVGIGTSLPTEKLELKNGIIKINNNNKTLKLNEFGLNSGSMVLSSNGAQANGWVRSFFAQSINWDNSNNSWNVNSNTITKDFAMMALGNNGTIDFYSRVAPSAQYTLNKVDLEEYKRMTIQNNGKVIIGNESNFGNLDGATGNRKLYVDGGIICEELEVQMSEDWADYVFNKNYNLKSLSEVESYINENHHLPNIPSAKEIKEDGIAVSEILKLQMEKIEELTLYVIELEKKVNQLNK